MQLKFYIKFHLLKRLNTTGRNVHRAVAQQLCFSDNQIKLKISFLNFLITRSFFSGRGNYWIYYNAAFFTLCGDNDEALIN